MGQKRADKVKKRKAKQKKRFLKTITRTAKTRECGPCYGCCKVYSIEGLPEYEALKPSGEVCKHVTDNENARCGIYASRPNTCRVYKCLWMRDGDSPKRLFYADERPDKVGIVFDLTDIDHPASKAVKRPIMVARPLREGVFEEEGAKRLIRRMMGMQQVVVLLHGPKDYEFMAADVRDAQKVAEAYSKLPDFKILEQS